MVVSHRKNKRAESRDNAGRVRKVYRLQSLGSLLAGCQGLVHRAASSGAETERLGCGDTAEPGEESGGPFLADAGENGGRSASEHEPGEAPPALARASKYDYDWTFERFPPCALLIFFRFRSDADHGQGKDVDRHGGACKEDGS